MYYSSFVTLLSLLYYIIYISPLQGNSSDNSNAAEFEIHDEIVVRNPPRFGANIIPPGMTHWNTEPWHNEWWAFPYLNPIHAMIRGYATGGSEWTLDDNGKNGKGQKIGYYDVFRDGFFNGGQARVYRFDNDSVSLVRDSKIAQYQASTNGLNKITFESAGPAVQAGDMYILSTVRTNIPIEMTRTWSQSPWVLCTGYRLSNKAHYQDGVRMVLSDDAPPVGGKLSLVLKVPKGWMGGAVGIGDWLISGQRADNPRFHSGSVYRLDAWLKLGKGLKKDVSVKIASMGSAKLKIDDEWRCYSTEFFGAPPKSKCAEALEFSLDGGGDFYIGNVRIIERDGPDPGEFYPVISRSLRAYHPGTLRLWPLQVHNGFGKSLDDALGPPSSANLGFQEGGGASPSMVVGLHQQLMLCQQVGADPWIITSTLFSEQEQRDLIEYLAGSPDTPYGAKRNAWGRKEPWTSAFHSIWIEMGNETWNLMFKNQGFPGNGAAYGAFSNYMFKQMQGSTCFEHDKIHFVINGFVGQPSADSWAFGAAALRKCPLAEAVDIALYTGGWDAVGTPVLSDNSERWRNILTYAIRFLFPLAKQFKDTLDKIAIQQGRAGSVRPMVYESGPGYTLPKPGYFNEEEQREGKSLGQAVNTLEVFMNNLRLGYGDQDFFLFKNGHYWASHNRNWQEHIVWKALSMRNNLLKGDLVRVVSKNVPTIDLPATQVEISSQAAFSNKALRQLPAVQGLTAVDCFPFRSGNSYSVMFVSLRDKDDTAVTVSIPQVGFELGKIYQLASSDPSINNIEDENLSVTCNDCRIRKGTIKATLPPHSVTVICFP